MDVTSSERFPMAGGLPLQPRQCVERGQLTGQVQAWYQDLLEDRLNALRSFAVFRLTADRRNPLVALKRSTRTVDRRETARIMKTILLVVLSMVAAARDATAQEDDNASANAPP